MRKLATAGVSIFLLVLLGACAAVILGRQQTLSPRYTEIGLGTPDCAVPCWLGIRPGMTRLEDAERHIFSTFNDQAPYSARLDPSSTDGLREISLTSTHDDNSIYVTLLAQDDETVDTIILRFNLSDAHARDLNPRIGDFYAQLGDPVRFGYTENTRYSLLVFGDNERGARMFFRPQRRLEPAHPMMWLMLYEYSAYGTVSSMDNLLPWSGFSAAVRYMDRLNAVRNAPLVKTGSQ
jgi:hypothetical protein